MIWRTKSASSLSGCASGACRGGTLSLNEGRLIVDGEQNLLVSVYLARNLELHFLLFPSGGGVCSPIASLALIPFFALLYEVERYGGQDRQLQGRLQQRGCLAESAARRRVGDWPQRQGGATEGHEKGQTL